MNDEVGQPCAKGAAAPLDEVQESVCSDLQYVSLQVDGRAYGGWYRMLTDGRMELLALANMHCERRPESTPVEQARGMLADFIRTARGDDEAQSSATPPAHESPRSQLTLGDLLYVDKTKARVAEDDWIALVRSIAAGDQYALDELFDRTHRIVFTLAMRLVGHREIAEELTLDVYHDVWRQACRFDAADGPVLAWLMNQARFRALQRLELEQTRQPMAAQVPGECRWLRNALAALSAHERQLIEAVYFSRLTYREVAAQRQQSAEAVQRHIHSGMEKLREKLDAAEAGP